MWFRGSSARARVLALGFGIALCACGSAVNKGASFWGATPKKGREKTAESLVGSIMSSTFNQSLESQQATDFLLTPALLVQEALIEGVVLSYPCE
jgi:hypothetical protein